MSEQTLREALAFIRHQGTLWEAHGKAENRELFSRRAQICYETAERLSAPVAQPVAWIPVTERLPEPNTWVLVNNGKWTGVGKHCPDCNEEVERWQSETTEFIELIGPKVIYWMPLPTEPEDKP